MITPETLRADARAEQLAANRAAAAERVFVIPFGAMLDVTPEDHGNAPEVFGELLASDYEGDAFVSLGAGRRKRACLPSC